MHQKCCKGGSILKGLEPLFAYWSKKGNSLTYNEKKIWRNALKTWLISRMKCEFYKGMKTLNPKREKISDDMDMKKNLHKAGNTIVPCLLGNHNECEVG